MEDCGVSGSYTQEGYVKNYLGNRINLKILKNKNIKGIQQLLPLLVASSQLPI